MLAPAQLPVKQNRLQPDKPNTFMNELDRLSSLVRICRLSFASARCFGEESERVRSFTAALLLELGNPIGNGSYHIARCFAG